MTKRKTQKNIAMKDSGVDWIGDIPSGWEYKKLKFISKINTGGFFGHDEIGEIESKLATTAQLSMNGDWDLDKMDKRFFSKFEYEKFKTDIGDIIIVKSSGSSTNIITGKAGYISKKEEGIVFGNFVMRARGTKIGKKLLYYFLVSDITRKRIELMVSSTTYPNLKVWEYLSAKILIPPKQTQEKIVGFLDEKTGAVAELVEKKKKMIELLKEKRSSLITHTITKGLDPNVEMKDSGIDWIGNIPSGWKVISLKKILTFEQPGRYVTNNFQEEKSSDSVPVLTANKKFILGYTDEVFDVFNKNFPIIIFDDFTTNKKFVDFKFKVRSTALKILKKRNTNNDIIKFVYYCMFVLKAHVLEHNRHWIAVYNLENIPHPLKPTQQKIVEFLDKKTSEIDDIISKIEKQIKLLDEYKASLIYHTVTGKIQNNI